MKNVLFLSTGGTIASTRSDEGLVPTLTADDLLRVIPQLAEVCGLRARTIMSIDSSNMQPENWVQIAEQVFEGLSGNDGIVVAHGTDTMAYTASALCFMLQNLNKPVILTGSQLSITDDGSDARKNIIDACAAACCGDLKGVFIVFDGKIIRGCRACKINTHDFHGFESINYPYIGTIFNRKIHLIHRPTPPRGAAVVLNTRHSTQVALIKLFPGIEPDVFKSLEISGVRAVIIEAFGAGGLVFLGRNLLPPVEKLLRKGIAVIITTQCLLGGSDLTQYEVGLKALKLGAIPACDMTCEALVAKVMWGLGQVDDAAGLRKILQTNFCDEVTLEQ